MQIRTESPNHAPVSSPTVTIELFQQDTVAQAIAETEKVLLVDALKDGTDSVLDDLVFKRRDA